LRPAARQKKGKTPTGFAPKEKKKEREKRTPPGFHSPARLPLRRRSSALLPAGRSPPLCRSSTTRPVPSLLSSLE
uniref:Uncharacterized protein n=1 Tax=Aegilops tauschii subsp. strangulata TaxID=200361 RepID=A0A453PVI0_AEGTS